jgi:hypothetical protein
MEVVIEDESSGMIRTILVTVAGLALSALSAAAGTFFVLRHTQFGLLMTGSHGGMSDPWKVFESGSRILFFCVCLPTVVLVAIFVGLLARKFALIAAAVAVLPIAVLASGLVLRGAWISLLLFICALALAGFAQRLVVHRLATN